MTFSDCADTVTPAYWLGRPGDLVQVRMPDENYDRAVTDHTAVHALLSGTAVDRTPYEQRSWTVSYEHIAYSTFLLIEQIRTRQRGLGPYVWIDPHTVNFMTQNQSSGTDAWLTTEGFAVTGTGESLATSTAVAAVRGQRTLAWTLAPTATGSGGGPLNLSTQYGPSGWATPPSQGWTFYGKSQGGNDDPVVTVAPRLLFLDVNGSVVGSATGVAITTAAGTWTDWIVTGTATASSAYVLPQLVATGGRNTALNQNTSFDVDATHWNPSGGTFVRSTAQFVTAPASGLLTPDGVTGTVELGSDLVAAFASQTYVVQCWLRCAATRSVNLGVNWYNASSTFITDSLQAVSLTANVWTRATVTLTAPSNAAFVQFKVQMTGTPPAGNTLFLDDAVIMGSSTVYLDELQLDMRIDPRGPRAWQPGQGQPRVAILANAESVTRVGRTNSAYQLLELTTST
jgi:hypothetical protein